MEYNKLRVANLLHGADYNPEQWLDRPDILVRDIELMKEAHCNVVSVGMFSWSMLEPEEGNYQFEWLESVINHLYDNGIYTILSTPSGARPHWLAKKYPTKEINVTTNIKLVKAFDISLKENLLAMKKAIIIVRKKRM